MGLVNRPATPDEIERMRGIMRQAMLDGAFGITTGLFYVPGTAINSASIWSGWH